MNGKGIISLIKRSWAALDGASRAAAWRAIVFVLVAGAIAFVMNLFVDFSDAKAVSEHSVAAYVMLAILVALLVVEVILVLRAYRLIRDAYLTRHPVGAGELPHWRGADAIILFLGITVAGNLPWAIVDVVQGLADSPDVFDVVASVMSLAIRIALIVVSCRRYVLDEGRQP